VNNTEVTRLLLISDDPQALTQFSTLSSAADFQVQHRAKAADARGALLAGAFDLCVFAPLRMSADLFQELTTTRTLVADLQLVVVLPVGESSETQQKLLAAGASLVLFQPVEQGSLISVLERLTGTSPTPAGHAQSVASAMPSRAAALSSALEVLRDFTQVLGYSLDYRQLTQHFILKLREVVGLSRIAIFLEPGKTSSLPALTLPETHILPCAAAVGLTADLTDCFSLSRKSGLGRQLTQHPQILRAPVGSAPSFLDPKIIREFEVLGGLVAIPINDRERTLGVAVLGDRITGGEFTDEELLLVYHLLEELGLAVKNSWLHTQLVGNHRIFSNVLNSLTVGALVLDANQQIIYTNSAITRFLRGPKALGIELADLPAPVLTKLLEVVQHDAAVEPFFHVVGDAAGTIYRATVIPLRTAGDRLPQTAMLLIEDFTQIRSAQRAEIESSNLKLISLIARRFAHEIRNSLVPLTTHAQLFDAEIGNAEFRDSLKGALTRETRRIQRFTDQMLLLARSDQPNTELAPLDEILQTSFAKSRAFAGGTAQLEIKTDLPPVTLRCSRANLAHAFQEIFLNGLQSTGENRQVHVTLNAAPTAEGAAELIIQVRDNGSGFAPESVSRATEPFFTTRNTGVGLGLTIARRIIEAHQGRLELHTRVAPDDPDLTVHLPLPH
jgi:signal transduction histidine kinase/DNA-binding NarL/FixJ family response regulator